MIGSDYYFMLHVIIIVLLSHNAVIIVVNLWSTLVVSPYWCYILSNNDSCIVHASPGVYMCQCRGRSCATCATYISIQ